MGCTGISVSGSGCITVIKCMCIVALGLIFDSPNRTETYSKREAERKDDIEYS